MKDIRIIRLFIVVLIAIGIGACTGDTLKLIDGPVVTEFPPNGSTNVQTTTGIYAIFAPNTSADPTTLNAQTVWLLQDGQTTVPIQVNYTSDMLDGGTLEIIAGDLQAGTTYTVVLSNDILLGGNTLGQVLTGEAPTGGLKPGAGRVGGRPGTVWDSGKMYRDEEVPVVGQQAQGLSVSLEDAEGGGVGVQQPDITSGSGEVAFSWSFATGGTPAAEPDEAPEEDPCTNTVQDDDETDVDCGGVCPTKCDTNQACVVDTDCISNDCQDDVCQYDPLIYCDNGVIDKNETDVDCGSSCPTKCAEGQHCLQDTDCESNVCDQEECQLLPKADGDPCDDGAECESGVCDETCQAPACDDDIQNGDEEDVDCGGASCTPCLASIGEACQNNDECASGVCYTEGTNTCVSCVNDTHCSAGRSCVNNFCIIDVGATDLN